MNKVFLTLLVFSCFSANASNLRCKLGKPSTRLSCQIYSWISYQGGWDGEEQEKVNLYRVEVYEENNERFCDTNVYYHMSNTVNEIKLLQFYGICPLKGGESE